ncbi:MAG: 3-oxoacyl-[acyl-carrier-protein] synthase chloroplastic [Chlamydiia bacterium]|nr:3-oxoacyl-[acyl-carrier-protein] synthase chloroplastic [Chlamydiia bacterium]
MKKKRIVVTGLGVVSCFGQDPNQFYEKLLAGVSGVTPITEFPCEDFATRFAAQVQGFDVGDYIDKKQARRVDKFIAYGMFAGKKALEDAKLTNLDALDKRRCGVILGSGMGGMTVFHDGVKNLLEKGHRRITPFFVPYILPNMAGALLAIDIGFMGPNYPISTACATSNYSIIAAAQHILNGEVDVMITGGVEAPISQIGMGGFIACKALSERNEAPEKASRPWDKGRDGFVMGEGAGVLVLESLEHALNRGAPILAEYLGGGVSCDAYHMTEPRADGEGVAICVRNALQSAGVAPEDVNYINAHATSTPLGDMAEINALKSVFLEPHKIKMNATKSMIGHALGAAGGLEAVAVVKAIQTGKIHPTINLEDPELVGFDTPIKQENLAINVAISNSFGFGGHNATIVFAPYKA